ncbi:NAD-dependent protein deacetylase [subsurface metagenome]
MVIGSTLIVYPAAYMPIYAVDSGAKLVIINLSSTPMDKQASVLIKAKAGETMSEIVQRVREKLTRSPSAQAVDSNPDTESYRQEPKQAKPPQPKPPRREDTDQISHHHSNAGNEG